MSMFYALIALCLSGQSLAQVVRSGYCPQVEVQENFDITQFTGRWYQQERISAAFQANTRCSIFIYEISPNDIINGTSISISTLTGREEKIHEDIFTPNPEEAAKTLINIPMSPVKGLNNLWIMGTDYDNWAVLFGCTAARGISAEYAWVLTRERVPDNSVLATANALLLENNIDISQFEIVKQKGCRN